MIAYIQSWTSHNSDYYEQLGLVAVRPTTPRVHHIVSQQYPARKNNKNKEKEILTTGVYTTEPDLKRKKMVSSEEKV